MTKIILLGDLHFGIKQDSRIIYEAYEKFINQCLFPYIEKNNIKYLIQVGDLVDKRKYITGVCLKATKLLLECFQEKGIECHFLVGNHDSVFKNTLSHNYVSEIIEGNYNNFHVYEEPKEIKINKKKILMIPWICKDNYSHCMNAIENSSAPIAIGHLELSGFQHYKGHIAKEGMSPKIFDKFHAVYSGHYHTRSNDSNITYLGTPLDLTWSDYDDQKGFHVLDTETMDIEFIPSPISLHMIYEYEDDKDVDMLIFKDKIVKITCNKEYQPQKFDNFINLLDKECYSRIIIDLTETIEHTISDEEIKVSDTLSIFKNYLKCENDQLLETLTEEIYKEALSLR